MVDRGAKEYMSVKLFTPPLIPGHGEYLYQYIAYQDTALE